MMFGILFSVHVLLSSSVQHRDYHIQHRDYHIYISAAHRFSHSSLLDDLTYHIIILYVGVINNSKPPPLFLRKTGS